METDYLMELPMSIARDRFLPKILNIIRIEHDQWNLFLKYLFYGNGVVKEQSYLQLFNKQMFSM